MKYFIIAGERSGDLHASFLMKELKKKDADAQFRIIGGDMMESEGGEIFLHYKKLSVMGFVEILAGVFRFLKIIKETKVEIENYKPDVLLLVDFAGFNMRIAKWAKLRGMKVHYYISPKAWAWNEKRAYDIKAYVDHLYCILPFETEFFKKFDYKIEYVGNPLLDEIKAFTPSGNFRNKHHFSDKPIIAILPGSRKQEIERNLYLMMSVINVFPEFQYVIAAVTHLPMAYYQQFERNDNIHIVCDETYDLLSESTYAIVCSGTATLETSLFNVPQVVCYQTSLISATIARALIKVKFVSLVNLIANRAIVKELLQDDFTPHNLLDELKLMINNEAHCQKILDGYDEVRSLMGDEGASERTAELIISYTKAN